ncbi:MAG: hypothetical protein ACO31I_18065 [Prochlorotrichaceae cyanobacterium]|jgi:hypothetical protein
MDIIALEHPPPIRLVRGTLLEFFDRGLLITKRFKESKRKRFRLKRGFRKL